MTKSVRARVGGVRGLRAWAGSRPPLLAPSLALSLVLLVGGALGLAGCGVRGSLEAPAAEPVETGNATPGTPGQPTPHKPSILDPLLR